jgi:hypothetical protein
MKTQKTAYPVKDGTSITDHFHFLERQQGYLHSLSQQLSSYHCVPRTAAHYHQLEKLNLALKGLMKENARLITSFTEDKGSIQQHFDRCEVQFDKMMKFKEEALNYIHQVSSQD